MAEDADPRRGLLLGVAHLPCLQLLVELARDRAVAVEARRAEEGEPDRVDEVAASRPVEAPAVVCCSLPPPPPTMTETVKPQSVPYQPALARVTRTTIGLVARRSPG